jgi:nucleotide-binding universal stress UspA family protein
MSTMQTPGPVAVGIDFSKQNAPAVEYAAAVAMRRHLPLVLLYALGPHQAPATYLALSTQALRGELAGELADQAATLREDYPCLEIRNEVIERSPTDALVEASREATMVVIGSRGHGPFGQLMLGSVAWRVVSRASGPVVLVRPADRVGPIATGSVLVGVDGSESAAAAIQFGFEEAMARGAGLIAVAVWALPHPEGLAIGRQWSAGSAEAAEWETQMQSDAARILSEALAGKREQYPDVHVSEVVIHGINVPQTLLDVAATRGAELLVVGARGTSAIAETVLGAVGVQLAHHADRTVAVIHS